MSLSAGRSLKDHRCHQPARSERLQPASQTLQFSSPRGSRFDPQHVPAVLAVADPADGICLLFGEANPHAGRRALPAIVTQVNDGRVKSLQTQGGVSRKEWSPKVVAVHRRSYCPCWLQAQTLKPGGAFAQLMNVQFPLPGPRELRFPVWKDPVLARIVGQAEKAKPHIYLKPTPAQC